MKKVLANIVDSCDISGAIPEETELEVTCRQMEGDRIYFIINFKDKELSIPSHFVGKIDLLSGNVIVKNEVMKPYEVRIISIDQ